MTGELRACVGCALRADSGGQLGECESVAWRRWEGQERRGVRDWGLVKVVSRLPQNPSGDTG